MVFDPLGKILGRPVKDRYGRNFKEVKKKPANYDEHPGLATCSNCKTIFDIGEDSSYSPYGTIKCDNCNTKIPTGYKNSPHIKAIIKRNREEE